MAAARRSGSGSTRGRARSRAAVTADVLSAGRKLSTAAVMFHTALAHRQGLTATDAKALDLIGRFGPLTAGDLGARAGLAPASVTGLVDRLEKRDLVRRVKDPADGRRVLVELNGAKLAAFAPLFDDLVREMHELAEEFSVEQLETIVRFLEEAARRQQAATARLTAAADPDD